MIKPSERKAQKSKTPKRKKRAGDHVFFIPFSKSLPKAPEGTKLLPLFATGRNPSWAPEVPNGKPE